jgi:hypothetical protein
MKKRITLCFAFLFALSSPFLFADDESKIEYYVIKMNKAGSIPEEISFLEKYIKAKGFTGAELIKSGKGKGTVELETFGHDVTMKFSDSKVRITVIRKKDKKKFIDTTLPIKKIPPKVDGPDVDKGKLLFVFKKS